MTLQAADTQSAQLDSRPFTATRSQFAVMFFDEPADAVANIQAHLRTSGRLGFACWQTAEQNPWSFASRLQQPKLSPSQEAHLVELYRAGGRTISELEELLSVTRSTIYRAIARAGDG